MSLTIELPISVERALRKQAEQQGVALESYISDLLSSIPTDNFTEQPKERTETQLLEKIQLNVAPQDLEEYYRLSALFKSGQITDTEHEKLLALNDLIEIAHAERIKYVIELAKLRNQPLEDVVLELGLKRKVA
jgi:hypothetical protein